MRDNFVLVSILKKTSVTQSLSKVCEENIELNREALISIIDIIITLEKRNITFKSNRNKEFLEEDGNVMYFVN